MKNQDRNIIIAGVAICIVIAVLAPYLASSNPDGLEKSALQLNATDESSDYQAPFADYNVPLLGNGPYSEAIALVIGILVMLGLGYLVAYIFKRRKPPEIDNGR